MLSEDLEIYKDTYRLCKELMKHSKNVSKLVRFGEYQVAMSKAFLAMDMIRVINSDINHRYDNLNRYLMLLGEVRSRITLFADLQLLQVKAATNLIYLIDKASREGTGWRKASTKFAR
mgnify:FL=1